MLKTLITSGLCVLGISSAAFAETAVRFEPNVIINRIFGVQSPVSSYQPIETRQASTAAGVFNANVIFLADQLHRNCDAETSAKPILVTSFSNLDNLSETTSFGRLVAEHLMHELKVRGWGVVDLRMTKSVIVNQTGEFSLSRDLGRIRESFPVGNVLVGTFSRTADGVLLSARVIDVTSGHVRSTAQSRFLGDRFVHNLVSVPVVYPVVKVGN
jgi:TolB-like protein